MADNGLPSSYTPELAREICDRMGEGESLRQICRDEHMPDRRTVVGWVIADPKFAKLYAEARELLYQRWGEEITEIADDGTNDWMERERQSGRIDRVPDREHIDRSRLRVDSRKWLLSKLQPKKYGDKLQVTGDGGGPLQTVSTLLTKDEFAALAKGIADEV